MRHISSYRVGDTNRCGNGDEERLSDSCKVIQLLAGLKLETDLLLHSSLTHYGEGVVNNGSKTDVVTVAL